LISSLRVDTSPLPLLLAALEACLWRSLARSGSCNQHRPLVALAGSVQRPPSRLMPAHVLIYASPRCFSSFATGGISLDEDLPDELRRKPHTRGDHRGRVAPVCELYDACHVAVGVASEAPVHLGLNPVGHAAPSFTGFTLFDEVAAKMTSSL
jgi:hypothetical protein